MRQIFRNKNIASVLLVDESPPTREACRGGEGEPRQDARAIGGQVFDGLIDRSCGAESGQAKAALPLVVD
jgi:hypothetical protein